MPDFHQPIQPQTFYHIYSRANGDEKLFLNDENYRFFLAKYKLHVNPVADTFAWCLLPNHFHFLIRCKSVAELEVHYQKVKGVKPSLSHQLPVFVMERFSNWLNSYTKAFNKVYERKGSLFIDNMRRISLASNSQCIQVLCYIHRNPMYHGFARGLDEWKWSSYRSFMSAGATDLKRALVLGWFNGMDDFMTCHQRTAKFEKVELPGE